MDVRLGGRDDETEAWKEIVRSTEERTLHCEPQGVSVQAWGIWGYILHFELWVVCVQRLGVGYTHCIVNYGG